MKVVCFWYATDEEKNRIKSLLPPGTEVVAPQGDYMSRYDCAYEDVKDLVQDADAIMGISVPAGALERAEKLKIFSYMHAGVDDLRQIGAIRLFKERGVKLTNIRGSNGVAVAEHAMMLVLALAKQTIVKHQASRERDRLMPIYGDQYRSAMLNGRTMLVVGVGTIGSRIAKHAKGFDMRVLGIRRNKDRQDNNVDSMHGIDELHDLLPQSDYVVLAAPITDETQGVFGARELKAMKSTAFLVNVSRGNLIKEKPLYEALTNGTLRGFATDVWPTYVYGRSFPVHAGSRLQINRLPNVTGTYDQAANADDVLERNIEWGAQNIAEFFAGKPLSREVSLDLGY